MVSKIIFGWKKRDGAAKLICKPEDGAEKVREKWTELLSGGAEKEGLVYVELWDSRNGRRKRKSFDKVVATGAPVTVPAAGEPAAAAE